jgi:hypothetical protein
MFRATDAGLSVNLKESITLAAWLCTLCMLEDRESTCAHMSPAVTIVVGHTDKVTWTNICFKKRYYSGWQTGQAAITLTRLRVDP